jgi:hypothetical protein
MASTEPQIRVSLPESETIEELHLMSLQTHLSQLAAKHDALERELHDAIHSPSTNDLRIAELKRKKLQLKDEIQRLQSSETLH